ncbi:MAG: MAPEG family protein [Rhodospirillales bacterium]|nr:MAPEG family protein [Rhodospirillales bacterium]
MALEIVPVYAALLGLIYIALTLRAVMARRTAQKLIGALGQEALDRRLRVHGNFAEYAPLALLLLAFAEARGASATALHAACAALVVGRLCHAWGVSRVPEVLRWRQIGMVLTLAAIAAATIRIFASYL